MSVDQLLDCCRRHDEEGLKNILSDDPCTIISSNYDGVTALHVASLFGFEAGVDLLLKKGANVHSRNVDGSTPLCQACNAGHVTIVKRLLDHGSLVNPPCLLTTPLHEAAINDNADCCELLIENGAKLEVSDCWYGTPLLSACFRGHLNAAKVLLDAGANVNARKIHATPLHYSAENFDVAMISLLLIYGADAVAKDNNDRKPSDLFMPSNPYHQGRRLLLHFESNAPTLRQLCRLRVLANRQRLCIADIADYPDVLKRFLLYDNVLNLLKNFRPNVKRD